MSDKQITEDWMEDEDMEQSRERSGRTPAMIGVLLAVVRRWYWLVLGTILGVSCSAYYLSKAPRMYISRATLLVKQQTIGVLSKEQPDEIDMRSSEALNTVAERLKRQSLLEKVAARDDVRSLNGLMPREVDWIPAWLGVWMGGGEAPAGGGAAPAPQPRVLAGAIGNWMNVSIRKGTRLMDVSITHPSPEAAKVVADAVAEEYISEMTRNRSQGRSSSIDLLTAKSEESRVSLQAAQKAMTAYMRALDSHDELEKNEREFATLKRRYLPKHPAMITATGKINAMQERFLADFDSAAKSGADQDYWKEAGNEWKPESQTLTQRLDIARRLLLSRTSVLRSEIQSQESVFNAILTKIQETDVNQAAPESEIEISSSAMEPGLPISPVPSKVYLMGGFGGLMLGVGFAWLLTRLDNRFQTVADLEEFSGLSALAAFPMVPFDDLEKKRISAIRTDDTVSAVSHEQKWASGIVFRIGLLSTPFAEMFRVLRASVSLLGREDACKVTLFTSSIPGEGKTFCSTNFALAAAAQGQKVLLLDLDLRKPTVHRFFGRSREDQPMGVADLLSGVSVLSDSLSEQVAPNLDVVFSCSKVVSPGESLEGGRVDSVLREARKLYDVIVIDTAPLLAVPDTQILVRHADNVCLVVRAGYVPKGAVARSLHLLAKARSNPSGVILNGFRERRFLMGSNYSYGYYSYGAGGYARRYGYGAYGTYGSDEK